MTIEQIAQDDRVFCFIIRAEMMPEKTIFLTPPEFKQQVGFIVYPAGGEVARHVHLPLERHLVGTAEVLVVKKGHCAMDIYNDAHELIDTRDLFTGDTVLLVAGGHGFRMIEDTIFLEIKQGPYLDTEEKERF